jgi:hypothetical protein
MSNYIFKLSKKSVLRCKVIIVNNVNTCPVIVYRLEYTRDIVYIKDLLPLVTLNSDTVTVTVTVTVTATATVTVTVTVTVTATVTASK